MPPFKCTLIGTLVGAVLCTPAFARDLPDFNILSERSAPRVATASASRLAAGTTARLNQAEREQLIANAASVQMNDALGVPSFVWAGPALARASVSAVRPAAQPAVAAQAYLRQYAPLYGLDRASLSGAELESVHDTGEGAVIASYTQKIDGIEVYGQKLALAMKRDMSLMSLSGNLSPRAEPQLQARASAGIASASTPFKLSMKEAVVRAFHDLGGQLATSALRDVGSKHGYQLLSANPVSGEYSLSEPVIIKKVWFDDGTSLLPAYYLEVVASEPGSTDSDAYAYVLSAVDGRLLLRANRILNDSFGYRVFADADGINLPWDGPQGRYGQPNPYNGQPGKLPSGAELFKPANLVVLEHGPISTRDPWLAPGATKTAGNNVLAYADAVAPEGFGPGDFFAEINSDAGGVRSFDYALDPTRFADADDTQRRAAVVQMFYLNNWLHDWFYDAGFDEQSGNAQMSNYGRGGREGDPLVAEAQDNSGTNNANLLPRPDGFPPRMQMYFYTQGRIESSLGTFFTRPSSFGPQFAYRLEGTVVRYVDQSGSDFACSAAQNAAALKGQIALIQRAGPEAASCGFLDKVKNAQAAGARAVLIYNHQANDDLPGMGGEDKEKLVKIPAQGITHADGQKLLARLAEGPVTLKLLLNNTRDSSVDALIMAHEWGHYISNRLVGGGVGLKNNQGRAMGEGWGDFHSLLMTVEKSDVQVLGNQNFGGVYAQGGYAEIDTDKPGVANTFYWGIRRVPYSVDMSKNGLTFKHIQKGVPLPTHHKVAAGADGASNAAVHNSGEVWATMLWECYVNLLTTYEFEIAQDKMKRYLVAGYKLTPANPTFVTARDGLVAAARASSEADAKLFMKAFAKRGLGVGAVAPPPLSDTHEGLVESFNAGDDGAPGGRAPGIVITAPAQVDAGAEVILDASGSRDSDGASYVWKQTAGTPVVLTGGTLARASFTAGQTSEILGFSLTVSKTVNGQLLSSTQSVTVQVKAAELRPPVVVVKAPAQVKARERVLLDASGSTDADGASLRYLWQQTGGAAVVLSGANSAQASFVAGSSDGLLSFSVTVSKTVAGKTVSATQAVTVQIKTDGVQPPKVVITAPAQVNGLDLVQLDGSASNDGGGSALRYQWTQLAGKSVTLTGAQTAKASFKAANANDTLRFALTVSNAQGARATSSVTVVVKALKADGKAPIANAGRDLFAVTNARVYLTGSSSRSADGSPLTYQWTQLSGAPVDIGAAKLKVATFRTPKTSGRLAFRLTVTDNKGRSSSDEVSVYVY